MATQYKKGAFALALCMGLTAATALAEDVQDASQSKQGAEQKQPGAQNQPGTQQYGSSQYQSNQPGFGGQQGQFGAGINPQCPGCGAQQNAPGWGGQQYGGQQYGAQQYGSGMGQSGMQGAMASAPQAWIADAALFIGNAANTAHVLGVEQGLHAHAPQILGNQAQFLTTATNRALTSLIALQQNAEATNPSAVPEIRSAVGHLVAAQAQAAQVADAANAGVLGPTFDTAVRATLGHLAAADRSVSAIGRAYGAPQLAQAGSACPMRAFGAGLGGQGPRSRAPQGGVKQGTPKQEGVKQGTPKQEGVKQEGLKDEAQP
ncbi:Hypothetical protein A7982_10154 [Minicystis rosea]|nr:Hypothetical protein A7982_10154 [Minicystis rosea]